MIEEFKLHYEELQERIRSLEDGIAQREQINQAQLEQQDREQVDAKNKYKTTHFVSVNFYHRKRRHSRWKLSQEFE